MTQAIRIDVDNQDRLAGIRSFLETFMHKTGIDAMLVPGRLAMKQRIMPMLVADPGELAQADPLSPAFPVNGAQQLARLTRQPGGGRLCAVLRSCEIRAFHELTKLNQGQREAVLIIGIDCPGAVSNTAFKAFVDGHASSDDATQSFCSAVAADELDGIGLEPTAACRACLHPTPNGADIAIDLFGIESDQPLTARAFSEAGQTALAALELPAAEIHPRHKAVLDKILEQRRETRRQMQASVAEATGTIQGLAAYLADCVNCYNCRTACPVCYCTSCVFTTDAFRHESFQYVQWARRKGGVKMPTDTLFYHLTRMAHMSTACVGCGQCTNACPNDIPLSDLFSTVAGRTQAAFNYAAGLDPNQRPPMCTFEKEEFDEVVGV